MRAPRRLRRRTRPWSGRARGVAARWRRSWRAARHRRSCPGALCSSAQAAGQQCDGAAVAGLQPVAVGALPALAAELAALPVGCDRRRQQQPDRCRAAGHVEDSDRHGAGPGPSAKRLHRQLRPDARRPSAWRVISGLTAEGGSRCTAARQAPNKGSPGNSFLCRLYRQHFDGPTGSSGSVSISREPDLDGGKLTLRMSLFAVTARSLIAAPAVASKHDGRTRNAEP
jgi:hypothetical protein